MHAGDALHFPGKFHRRRAVAAARFHIAVGSQLREHLALNPAFLCPDGLALTRGKWRTVRRFLRFNALLLPLAQFLRNIGGHPTTPGGGKGRYQSGELVLKGFEVIHPIYSPVRHYSTSQQGASPAPAVAAPGCSQRTLRRRPL
ncbi:hypothetical protein KONIH1_22065 [Klebsiella oxytoca KONIH1]|nr:hypothetical protein KONIH1_22065 [Klebsiella oxytoca KONIH1]